MVDLIQKTYVDRLTLQTLGTALGGKPDSLGRIFHAVVGVSVHEYVTRVRLEHAAHLIRSGLKIEAVAYAVGYRSKKNFYRQFIKRYGITPEAYRRRHGERRNVVGSGGAHADAIENGMVTFAGSFDDTACLVQVEIRPNVFGRPTFVATPLVIVNHGVQPIAATSAYIEIRGENESEALERAAIFLEHRFGPRRGTLKRQQKQRELELLAPRP
jgi:AraC-like DNA-binding protein